MTQSDPFSMSISGIAISGRVELLDDCIPAQSWFADNNNAVGSHDNPDNLKTCFWKIIILLTIVRNYPCFYQTKTQQRLINDKL